jgi:hypothetical protein
MKSHASLARFLAGCFAGLALVLGTNQPVHATDSVGVSFTVINRATIRAFDAVRRYRELNPPGTHEGRIWRIELQASRMIDVVTVEFVVQPGGHGGWHTHPGPAFFTVSEGTLTIYDGDDPGCTPQLFPAGTGSMEAESSSHIHITRNETSSVVKTVVTFLVPVGSPLRTDLPDPGNCPF